MTGKLSSAQADPLFNLSLNPYKSVMADHHLDLKGLKCPLPALRTGKALSVLRPGEVLHVTATDPMANIDIPHLVSQRGDRLIECEEVDGRFYFMIERGARPEKAKGE
jgi:tRNA 2-thiouridine synthesizing protein A